MSEVPPTGDSSNSQHEPRFDETGRKPQSDKRPVSVRAKETANTGYLAVRWGVLLVLVVIAAVFIIRNFERVQIDWVFRTSSVPLSLIMIAFLAIGFVIGWLVHWSSARARRRQ